MPKLALVLAALFFALVAPAARAQSSTIETALAQMPAAEPLWGHLRMVDIVDLAALKEASGIPKGLRFDNSKSLPETTHKQLQSMYFRIVSDASFLQFMLVGAERWEELIGVDFLEVEWFSQAGTAPHNMLLLGGEALPRGEDLSVLANGGLEPQEHGGVTVWVKGDRDYGTDPEGRDMAFPFWGHLGSSVRVFRSEAALVGARAWSELDLAVAVAAGEAESLADLPRFRLAAEAAEARAFSAGPVLQIFFADEEFDEGVIGEPPRPDGLPPFGLLAVADRQDPRGQQAVIVLTYEDADTAKEASQLLLKAAEDYRDKRDRSLADSFPGLKFRAATHSTDDGSAAVLRLSIPRVPLMDDNGRVDNASKLYQRIYEMLIRREADFLAVRE